MNEGPQKAQGGALPLRSEKSTSNSLPSNSPGDGDNDPPDRKPKRARRTFMTQNACRRCRQKKSKCDGRRPTCGRCAKFGAECVYDVAQEGLTRMQNLQQQLESKSYDHDRLQELLGAMGRGSEQEATSLLAQLRLNVSIDDMLDFARSTHGSSSNVTDDPNLTDGAPQAEESPTPPHFSQYQFQTQPGYPPTFSTEVSPNTGHWTDQQFSTIGQPVLQSQPAVVPSQGFPHYFEGQESEFYPTVEGGGEGRPQPDVINWQMQQGAMPPGQYPMPEDFRYEVYPTQPGQRRQSQGGQSQRGPPQGSQRQHRAPGQDRR